MATNPPTGLISLFLHPPIGTMVREQLPAEPYSGLVSVNRPRGVAGTDAFGIRFLLLSLPPGYGQTPVAGLTETDRRVVTITTHHQLFDGNIIVTSSASFSNTTDQVLFAESLPHHVELEFAPGVTARLWWLLVL